MRQHLAQRQNKQGVHPRERHSASNLRGNRLDRGLQSQRNLTSLSQQVRPILYDDTLACAQNCCRDRIVGAAIQLWSGPGQTGTMIWQSVFSGTSSTYTFYTGLPASLPNLPKLLLNLQSSHSLHSLHFAPWHSPYSRYTYMPAVTPAPHPTVEPTADSLLIKMLKDTSYVDTGESTNLAQSITNVGLGSGLNQGMTSFTSGTMSTELDEFDCFVVPELERSDFYSALSSTDITAVASWVSEGRVMVVSADYNGRAVSLLNGVFGWSLSLGSIMFHTCSPTLLRAHFRPPPQPPASRARRQFATSTRSSAAVGQHRRRQCRSW